VELLDVVLPLEIVMLELELLELDEPPPTVIVVVEVCPEFW